MTFTALRVFKRKKPQLGTFCELTKMNINDLNAGEVLIKVHYSCINFKDALAVTGQGKIMRNYPLNAGIDVAGEVVESSHANFKEGDRVIANGCGLGESHDGGLSEYARLPADWVINLPKGLSMKEAMTIGTAGFTAVLALHKMEMNGQSPEMGPIVVTGASGGVGSFAVDVLAKIGYDVIAVSGREEYHQLLKNMGAMKVLKPSELALGDALLDNIRFGGAIDNVGGKLLSQLIASTELWGNVASIGLAASHKLDSSVFPFILRGVNLLGISSSNCPMTLRKTIWNKLGAELKPAHLKDILIEEISLQKVFDVSESMLLRKRRGRTIVKIV